MSKIDIRKPMLRPFIFKQDHKYNEIDKNAIGSFPIATVQKLNEGKNKINSMIFLTDPRLE